VFGVGRIFSLIASAFGFFVGASAATWWINTVTIGLFLRRVERNPVVRRGPIVKCVVILWSIWIAFSLATVLIVLVLFLILRLAFSEWLRGALPAALFSAGYWLFVAAISLAVLVGVFAGFSEVFGAAGAAKRRRILLDLSAPRQNVDIEPRKGPGRRIVILCDGTSNKPDTHPDGESIATNIWKLSQMLKDDDIQTVWYEAGVGSDSSSTAAKARRTQTLLSITGLAQGAKIAAGGDMLLKAIEGGFGVGISETIVNGYKTIVRLYRPGDRIYLIGFSRGAFAARCIAGVISRCGLLRAEYERFAPDVVQLYRTRLSPNDEESLRIDMAYPGRGSKQARESDFRHPVVVEFVGLFDTVASLGFPLWGWWFRALPVWENLPFSSDPASVCRNIYHALAMDERRAQFFPTLFTKPASEPRPDVLEQVWFRGAHADIGGGYTRHDLSDTPLEWMMGAMTRHGLVFNEGARKNLIPNLVATPHDELVRDPTWNFFGSWPRWHPVTEEEVGLYQPSKLHSSVVCRAKAVEFQTGRPDLLAITKREEFVVNANAPWFRTGMIIATGMCYKLTYIGGLTRDGERGPADPSGQRAGWFDLRNNPLLKPRLPDENWMLLCAAIAHPRIWTPQEKGILAALGYLFRKAPELLLNQIAAIGDDLVTVPGKSIFIKSEAPSGLLYLFVNDLWQTAGDNSGGPKLSIEPFEEAEIKAQGPLYTLKNKVEEEPDGPPNETNEWVRFPPREPRG
jgi:uncharacterized protein (DUF2235 family)